MLKRLFPKKNISHAVPTVHAPLPISNSDFYSSVTSQVDDSSGWQTVSHRRHDRDYSEIQELYSDALTAWRKNPIAFRIITLTTSFVLGRDFKVSAADPNLNRFIQAFWTHPKNQMDLRLPSMCDELSRAGDLFVTLHRNPGDGMSYIRFVTKDNIQRIVTAENDWETETAFLELQPGSVEPRQWPQADAEGADDAPAVMLHYAVNRPIGALMGESDLATMLPWLQRYSRMLEDRVRLHWAARAFLYLVTVPSNKVESKAEQYRAAPESGSIIVKDETENWETMTPSLRGADAGHDMKAVRNLIDAGSGFPPHWRGEGGDVNLATAEAMQGPPERFLVKRQQYFLYVIEDILYHAYQRAAALGFYPALQTNDFERLFAPEIPDVSLRDNALLAEAANHIANAFASLQSMRANGAPPDLARRAEELILKFAGVRG
jgi:hypothetical protein